MNNAASDGAPALTRHAIAIDTKTMQRASGSILSLVRRQVPAADLPYVLRGAVLVGLNRIISTTADDFAVKGAPDDFAEVEIDAIDIARAGALAEARETTFARVLSAALCSGVATLAGDVAIAGPFEEGRPAASGPDGDAPANELQALRVGGRMIDVHAA